VAKSHGKNIIFVQEWCGRSHLGEPKLMSVMGQKRTLRGVRLTSTLPPNADIQTRTLIERVGMSALCQEATLVTFLHRPNQLGRPRLVSNCSAYPNMIWWQSGLISVIHNLISSF
jgi:hypothetical protein